MPFFFFAFISDFVSRFDFYTDLQNKLQNPAKVVTVFDRVQMHGEKGAVATVDMPPGNFTNKTCETMNVWNVLCLSRHFISEVTNIIIVWSDWI